jgi:hypothetical protein
MNEDVLSILSWCILSLLLLALFIPFIDDIRMKNINGGLPSKDVNKPTNDKDGSK